MISSTPVLIAGGGPSGLAAAAELAYHGIECTVIEPRVDVSRDRPRAKTTSVRTMEHFRRWGVAPLIRAAAPLSPDWSDRVVFCTSVTGEVITEFDDVFGLGLETLQVSPERGQQIPQPLVESVLRSHLAESPLVSFRYGSTVTGVNETPKGVTVTVSDTDGGEARIESAYLLGCDGAASTVRKAIGVNYVGTSDPRPNFNVVFRAADLEPAMGDAVHYWVIGADTPGVVGRLDLDDRWWLIAPGVEQQDGENRIGEIVTSLVGRPIDHQVISTDSWTARLLVAESFQTRRVFLVGESAHLNPPWGGHGFNTSVGDAVNIGWKLAAVLNGWAPEGLLQSYETERRPIAEQTISVAQENMRALPIDLGAHRTRAATAAAIHLAKNAEFHSLGLVLGYRYAGSPGDAVHFVPTSAPGARLPHGWYTDGTAVFDALGPEYSLLVPVGADLKSVRAQADALRLPLTIVHPPDDYPWANDTLLIRPDQHIAARESAAVLIDLELALT